MLLLQVFLSHLAQAHASSSLVPLLRCPLMDGDEQQLVLKGFNHTTRPYDTTSLVHRMFAEHAQRQPEAPCVIYEDRVYSYAEVRWFVLVSIHAKLAPLLTLHLLPVCPASGVCGGEQCHAHMPCLTCAEWLVCCARRLTLPPTASRTTCATRRRLCLVASSASCCCAAR